MFQKLINLFKRKPKIESKIILEPLIESTKLDSINGSKIIMRDIIIDLRCNFGIDINENDYFKPEYMTKHSLHYLIHKLEGKEISRMAIALNRNIKIDEILND